MHAALDIHADLCSLYARMATTNYQEATMATATKAKKATREFWISRNPGSSIVEIWRGKNQPEWTKAPPRKCEICNDPECIENQPGADGFNQRGGYVAATECVSDFRRVTGISVKDGETLLVRMTVRKRVK